MDAPELPGHIVSDEIWRWLAPRRTRFDRAVHRFYGKIGGAVVRLLPGHRDPAEQEAGYIEAEQSQLNRALEEIYAKLELVEATATPVVRRELAPILTGEERRRAFDELQAGLARTPLLTEAYRQSIAQRARAVRGQEPQDDAGHRMGTGGHSRDPAGHHALHVRRCRPGGPRGTSRWYPFDGSDLRRPGGRNRSHGGGEGTLAGLGSPAKKLLADLFAKYYEERATFLARMVHDCVLGRHLERIDRLATLAESEDYPVCGANCRRPVPRARRPGGVTAGLCR